MYSFEQASAIWMAVQPSVPATSAQSNWQAAATEARQLADELIRNLEQLRQYWSGPAAEEFTKSMTTLAGFAGALSNDMVNMATGLSQMATYAETARAKAMVIIATHQHPYMRHAGAVQLNALMISTGTQYESAKATYWKEPTQAPGKLPDRNAGAEDANPKVLDNAGEIPAKRDLLSEIPDLLKVLPMVQDGFGLNDHEFPTDVPSSDVDTSTGPLPVGSLPADDPSFKPVPLPESNFTDPTPVVNGHDSTRLAAAGPVVGTPTTGLATTGGTGMSPAGGGMGPMGMMGGGGGFAAAARGSAPKSGTTSGSGSSLFGPPMMGGGAKRKGDEEESGVHTWLTEDEMAWDGDAAPAAVTGRDQPQGTTR